MLFVEAYKRAFSIIKKKPLRLWGLSLLTLVIAVFAIVLTLPVLGIVGASFIAVVYTGMSKVYLDALDEKEVNSDQLFSGFKRFWTVLGGVAWKALWIFIWAALSVAAGAVVVMLFTVIGYSFGAKALQIFSIIGAVLGYIVMAAGYVYTIYKSYSYAFVEYILMTEENVTATQALRLSIKLTKGKMLQMFLADLVFSVGTSLVIGILAGLALIPYVGFLFGIVAIVVYIAVLLFSGIFTGLYRAYFFKAPVPVKKIQ
ncbi:MAG: DUF975 family protein, partial [Clostridia bacterium]|nr:DUF975 family protein [Clostridia bacterium]